MKTLLLALALSLPAHSQASVAWGTTGPYKPSESIIAGAVISPLVAVYCYQSKAYKYPALMTVLYTMALSLLFEGYQYACGKTAYPLNSLYAGLGSIPVSLTIKFTF